jgi:phenylacetate-coenzyme A ligase PaaK-like adenylate-forming protein
MTPDTSSIFSIKDRHGFLAKALEVFHYQYSGNTVYREFCDYLKVNPKKISTLEDIPFLPIQFFKSKNVLVGSREPKAIFTSSGTTGQTTSKHKVTDLALYENSFLKGFELFYGPITDYCILALLPSYLERQGSSLIYMVNALIEKSNHPKSGFFLHNLDDLVHQLGSFENDGKKVLLIGVSFALLDLAERIHFPLKNTIVMETGGMKGRRKEMIRSELHHILKGALAVKRIHSEYGMTELLSQAYSKGNGVFECPPWMKVLTRDTEDPLTFQKNGKTGGLNVVDLPTSTPAPS